VTFPAYPEVLPLACTATKRPNGDTRMAVAMQKLESAESDRKRSGDPEGPTPRIRQLKTSSRCTN